jgi:hypothetical protein
MRNITGKISLLVFLFIALSYNGGLLHSHNFTHKTNTEFSLQEEHQLAGDLELKHNSRTNSVITYSYNNLISYLTDFTFDSFKYILQAKSAKGFFLLKKHFALIYVYHNFW